MIKTLGMWYSSRAETDDRRVRLSTNTSMYLHQDIGYEQPSQHNRAQDVQKLFITPRHHRHINIIQGRFNSIFIGTEIGNTKKDKDSVPNKKFPFYYCLRIYFFEKSLYWGQMNHGLSKFVCV